MSIRVTFVPSVRAKQRSALYLFEPCSQRGRPATIEDVRLAGLGSPGYQEAVVGKLLAERGDRVHGLIKRMGRYGPESTRRRSRGWFDLRRAIAELARSSGGAISRPDQESRHNEETCTLLWSLFD